MAEHTTQEAASAPWRSRLERWTGAIAIAGFGGLGLVAILTFYDGVARYSGLPRVSGFSDYAQISYQLVIASCFPALLLRGRNVTIRFLGKALGARPSSWLETFGSFVTLIFFLVMAWQFLLLTADFQANHRTTRTIEMPLAPWWWATTALIVLTLPVQAYVFASNLADAIAGRNVVVSDEFTSEA